MNLLRKMADVVIRRLTVREPDGWFPDSMRGDAGEVVTDNTALSLSPVWACVNLLCGTQATLPLAPYRPARDGSMVIARDHYLYRILHDSPNFDQTAVDFWEFMCASIELWGNAYARIDRGGGGKVASLVPINPSMVVTRRLASGSIEYRWTDEGRQFVETDRDVLHIRGPGGSPLGGMSTLHFARNTFSLARALDRSAGATFRNGMRPSVQIAFDKWLTPEQRALAETKLADKYVGAMNAGRPFVAEGGAEAKPISINPDDAQMLESRSFSVEDICRFFGVPPFMIGHTEKSTSWGTGLEQQTLGFLKFTLRRRLKRIEQALEKQLLTTAERGEGMRITFKLEGLLRADSAGRARFYQQMTQIGAMTINEVRALENLPPVEGGDVPRMQMQNTPITEAGEQPDRLPAPKEE